MTTPVNPDKYIGSEWLYAEDFRTTPEGRYLPMRAKIVSWHEANSITKKVKFESKAIGIIRLELPDGGGLKYFPLCPTNFHLITRRFDGNKDHRGWIGQEIVMAVRLVEKPPSEKGALPEKVVGIRISYNPPGVQRTILLSSKVQKHIGEDPSTYVDRNRKPDSKPKDTTE